MATRHFAGQTGQFGTSTNRSRRPQPVASKRNRWERRFDPSLAARDLMNASVVTARPEDSVARAARLISETECGTLPVVDSLGRLIGIITNSDITTKLIARGVNVAHAQVSDCMTDQAFACHADTSIENCLRAMSWHQVRRLPIVDHDHKVIGIICRRDLAQYLCEQPDRTVPLAIADVLWALA